LTKDVKNSHKLAIASKQSNCYCIDYYYARV